VEEKQRSDDERLLEVSHRYGLESHTLVIHDLRRPHEVAEETDEVDDLKISVQLRTSLFPCDPVFS
jgi:hypothetical protein